MAVYTIRVEGPVGIGRTPALRGLSMTDNGDGSTTLRGKLTDGEELRDVLLALLRHQVRVLTVRANHSSIAA